MDWAFLSPATERLTRLIGIGKFSATEFIQPSPSAAAVSEAKDANNPEGSGFFSSPRLIPLRL